MAETRSTNTNPVADTENTVAIPASTTKLVMINNSDHAFYYSGVLGRSNGDKVLPARSVRIKTDIPPNIYWQSGNITDQLILDLSQ